nr:hypothetical protein [Sphingomonas sp. CDS-1]
MSKANLVGYLKPTGDAAGFILPVFQLSGANSLSVQTIGQDGTVSGFEQIFPTQLREVPEDEACSVAIGEPAIWGYAHGPGRREFDVRAALQRQLRPCIAEAKDPFLQLQLARFCDADADLAVAWQKAFRHMHKLAPRSAIAWRDLVVLPAVVRQAVAEIAREHGIEADDDYWEHGVETQIDAGWLTVFLISPLLILFDQHDTARDQLEDRTKAVREAFGIQTDRLDLRSLSMPLLDEQTTTTPEVPRAGRVVVGLGRMAENLMRAAFKVSHLAEAMPDRESVPPHLIEPMLIVRDNEPVYDSRLPDDFSLLDLGNPADMVVVFELNERNGSLLRVACDLAERYAKQGSRVTAVIPHFPEPVFGLTDADTDIPAWLQSSWDAIWFLGDRSPSIGLQNNPFGPARSPEVVTRHFRFTLDHGVGWTGSNAQGSLPFTKARCIVVGSAKGDRTAPTLLQHAVGRLLHPEIDLAQADAALILTETDRPRRTDVLRTYLRQAMSRVDVTIKNKEGPASGYRELIVAAHGVTLHRATARSFEEMCGFELSKSWEVVGSRFDGHDLEIERRGKRLLIDCKFDYDGRGGVYKKQVGKRWRDDIIVITTKPVRRKPFLRHVLNGQTTIHYSRISNLETIHNRRFSHVINAIAKGELDIEREVFPACLNWLAVQKGITDLLSAPARVEISDRSQLDHGSGPGIHMFRLPLLIKTQKASENVMPAFASAQLILDERGWRLLSLEPR